MPAYLHCKDCIAECPKGESHASYARLQIAIDEDGLNILCMRHQKVVAIIDPVQLLDLMNRSTTCDLCEKGVPHEHKQ